MAQAVASVRTAHSSLAFASGDLLFLAAGTAPGSVGGHNLTLFNTNSSGLLTIAATLPSPVGFARLAWSKATEATCWSPGLAAGIIAGGMETGAVAIWDPRSLLRDFEMGSSSGATVIEDYFAPKESLHFDVTTTNLVNGAAPSTLEFTLIEDYFSPEGPSAPRILTTTGDLARARSGAEGLRIIEDYFSPDGPPAPGILSTTSPATWSESDTPSMVALLLRHSDPVRGLTFSSQTPGFLASGAAHGKITVWDLANPSVENIPTLEFTEGDNVNISDLSWSPLMPCTISSASNVGAAIWDLNVNSPLIRKLPWMRKCTAIEWSPSNKNLMVVAARDFCDLPAVKVWDLRRMDRPVLQFCEDTKGVLALSWCPFDEDILAACTNDEKILILNAKKGEIVEEMTAPGTCFDIRWSKNLEDHFAISSSEQVDLYYRAPEI